MDTQKILSSALVGVILLTSVSDAVFADDMADVQAALQKIQTPDTGLPTISKPKGTFGDIMGKIFYPYNYSTTSLRGKIKRDYLDVPDVATTVNTSVNGIAGYLPKFTGSQNIGNSNIFDDGTNIGIGIATPSAKLDVNGTLKSSSIISSNGLTVSAGTISLPSGSLTSSMIADGTISNIDISSSAGIAPSKIALDSSNRFVTDAQITSWNAKLSSELDPKVGALSSNYIPKWNGSTLANGLIYDNGTNVGIGTTSPGSRLTISGGDIQLDNAQYYKGKTTSTATRMLGINGSNELYIGSVDAAVGGMHFNNNGSDFMLIASSGNVGIGTSSPGAKLDVVGNTNISSASSPTLSLYDSSNLTTTESPRMRFYGANGSWFWLDNIGSAFRISNGTIPGSGPMVLDNNGNVGIGNTAPAYKLDVNGNGHFTSTLTVDGAINGILTSSMNAANISAGTFGSNTGNGNYTFPAAVKVTGDLTSGRITLRDDSIENQATNGNAGVAVNYFGYAGGTTQFRDFNIYNGKAGQIAFFQGATSNVGIGTTSPAYKLDVSGDIRATGKIKTSAFTAGDYYDLEGGKIGASGNIYSYGAICSGNASSDCAAGGGVTISNGAVPGSPVVAIASSGNSWFGGGNVGIGTQTPGVKLEVAGSANFGGQTANGISHYQFEGATYRNYSDFTPGVLIRQDNSAVGYSGFKPALSLYNNDGGLNTTVGLAFVSREANGAGNAAELGGIMAIKEIAGNANAWTQGGLNFYTQNSGTRVDALRILTGGNVGIGTTTPGYKLDVAGSVNSTGLCIAGDCKTAWSQITASSMPWTSVTGRPTVVSAFTNDMNYGTRWYDGWVTNPGYDANTIGASKSGFSYANNAPFSGPLVHFDAGGYNLQLSAPYGGGSHLSFRTRNGDSGTWNPWYETINTANIGSQSVNYANTAGSAPASDVPSQSKNLNQWVNTNSDPTFNSTYYANGNLRLYQGDGTALRVQTAYGWMNLGAQNGSWTHMYSDKNFYFNQDLYVNGTQLVKNSGTWGINITGNSATATTADKVSGYGSSPDNSHPGSGMRPFYSWNIGQANNATSGYSNGITIGSNPGDTAYGFQIVQNMWDDQLYFRRYNGGWQGWRTACDNSNNCGYRAFNTWQNSHYSGTDGAEYATIFYDANNSGYYVDPASTSNFNLVTVAGNLATGSNAAGIGYGNEMWTSWINYRNASVVNIGNGAANGSLGQLNANDVRSSIFYDNSNTAYYMVPRSTSRMNEIQADRVYGFSDIRSPIFYDYNDTGYYMDPNSYSNMYMVNRQRGYNSTEYDYNDTTYYVDPNNTSVYNALYANVYYYRSDARLKENVKKIESSLEKIKKLNGYTFDWKKDKRHDVGVIAQEVEKVFPEVVHSDVKDGYKSVEYGNLVAPVIEAIKELSNKVDDLFVKYFDQEKKIDDLQKQINELKTAISAKK